jgi:biopolymer transport protein ExbD
VVLKGDAAAHYDKVSEVLEVCKRLNITEIGLVTKKGQE